MVSMLPLLLLTTAHAGSTVGGGYFGESAAHPGLIGTLTLQRDGPMFVAADVGSYWHPRAQVGVYSDVRLGWRPARDDGYTPDVTIGLGYHHSFLAAETVNFDNTGSPGLMPLLDVGVLGWTLPRADAPALRARLGLRIFGRYPVNTHMTTHAALSLTLHRVL